MNAIRSYWADRPVLDLLPITLGAAVLSVAALYAGLPGAPDVLMAFLAAVAGIAGLALAAGTFVCTMTYQSTNYLMSDLRRLHHAAIRHNWIWILSSLLLSGIGAAFTVLISRWAPHAALVLGITLAMVTLVVSLRAVWWLKQTLFIEDAATALPEVRGYDRELLARKH